MRVGGTHRGLFTFKKLQERTLAIAKDAGDACLGVAPTRFDEQRVELGNVKRACGYTRIHQFKAGVILRPACAHLLAMGLRLAHTDARRPRRMRTAFAVGWTFGALLTQTTRCQVGVRYQK
jgi:hypothetical protein